MKNDVDIIKPLSTARTIGIFYVLLAILGPFSMMYVPQTIFVGGDALSTVQNIIQHDFLFKLGMVGSCGILLVEVLLCTQRYKLFSVVSRSMTLTAISARLLMVAVQAVIIIFQGIALELADAEGYLGKFR